MTNFAKTLGCLTPEEYVLRRSPTLIADPKATLNEKEELGRYFSALKEEYTEGLAQLSSSITQSLRTTTRIIVCIIAYNEGSRIRKTLDNYAKQDIDPNLFEIIILDNHPLSKPKDNTEEEIRKFSIDNPLLSVSYVHKIWQEDEASVGNARKHVFDIALARIRTRDEYAQETILVSNDADTVSLDTNYLSAILEAFDTTRKTDALVTRIVVPFGTIIKPNIFGALSLWDELDEIVAQGEPYNLRGASCAFRTSIYVAVGGFNQRSKQTEDLELGWVIADARGWDADSVVYLKNTKSVQDPRRILEAVASRIPVNEMYYNFMSNPEIRQADSDALLTFIPDELDWELLEEDMDSFWQGRTTGMYKWRGVRFENDYKEAATRIGIDYEILNDRVRLKNIDGLIDYFQREFGKVPNIIHSHVRPWDQKRQDEMKKFFWNIADSMIAVRQNIAERVAKDIESTSKNDQVRLNNLFARYKRFAGADYEKSST